MRGRGRWRMAVLIVMVTSLLLPPGLGGWSSGTVKADEVNLIQNGSFDFDLGSVTQATYVGISWVRGNERQFYFHVLTSTDGVTWTNVFTGPSLGKVGGDYEIYDIPGTAARYVQIAVSGSNQSSVTSMTDVMVYGSQP